MILKRICFLVDDKSSIYIKIGLKKKSDLCDLECNIELMIW